MKKEDATEIFNSYIEIFSMFFPVSETKIKFHEKHPETNEYRAVAWAIRENKTVNILNRALEFDEDTITGLIIHEIGHICDPFVSSGGCEQRADDIAELVTGRRVKYSKPYLLQTVGSGMYPRPKNLHQ